MNQEHYLTAEGAARLKEELERLKGPEREELAKRLRSAIQQGDLSENADYHKAKEDQSFLEGRIQELEDTLRNVVIIKEGQQTDKVYIGSHVTIQMDGEDTMTYHLVGPKEADPRQGRISHESPIGKVLLDRKAGEEVIAETPGGSMRLKIIKIE